MKKLLAAVFAGMFAISMTAPAFAAAKDEKKEMKNDTKKKSSKKEKAESK